MYELQGLHDPMFLTLYVAAACLALVAAIVASHVWWYILGQVWLTDDRLVRNIVAIALDHVTLVPFTMAVLLAMLQDHRGPTSCTRRTAATS